MRKRHNSVWMNHEAGKRTAEARRCPTCGRSGALINRLDEHGNRVCRWAESGRCPPPPLRTTQRKEQLMDRLDLHRLANCPDVQEALTVLRGAGVTASNFEKLVATRPRRTVLATHTRLSDGRVVPRGSREEAVDHYGEQAVADLEGQVLGVTEDVPRDDRPDIGSYRNSTEDDIDAMQ